MNTTASPGAREASAQCPAAQQQRLLYRDVDFITLVSRGDEANSEVDFFAVDEENFEQGNLTGARAAFQLLAFCRTTDGHVELFRSAIERAVQLASDPAAQNLAHSKVGAAVGFLDEIEEILQVACRTIDVEGYIQKRGERLLTFMEQDLAEQRQKNQALLAGMQKRAPATSASA